MKRFTIWLTLAFFILLATQVAAAQGPSTEHSEINWHATYWNNSTLSGAAALEREEAAIDYNWGAEAPAAGITADHFSARWTRTIDETPGTYRFTATSDDGMRVWLDGALIVNDWSDHAARTVTADVQLAAGHHQVTVEYYENGGQATAKLSWAPVTTITTWRGEYFNNATLTGTPALVRDDAQVLFDWGYGSPLSGTIGSDTFSARWTRRLNFAAGNYTFSVTADDGVRLWVNGHLLVDAWQVQAARTFSNNIYLPAGNADIKLEYFENTGQAVARLSWAPAGTTPPPGPPPAGSIVVDNSSAGFMVGGYDGSWRSVAEGYNGSLLWTKNNDDPRPNYNWARWYPTLAAGKRYEVFVYIPDRYTTTTAAHYWVSHRDGYTLKIVSQSANGNRWVSLGSYTFQGNDRDYVSLSDVTGETYLSRLIAFDAVRFDPR